MTITTPATASTKDPAPKAPPVATTAGTAATPLQINALDVRTMFVPIRGLSPLIMHNFTAKSKQQMLDAMQGIKKVKTVRKPEEDYEGSFYKIERADGTSGYGFPVLGFKAASVSAARFFDKSITMTTLRQVMFFRGERSAADVQELVEIIGTPRMREDVVRVGMGTADLRYRAEFEDWSATLQVKYIPSSIDRDSVLAVINAGGFGVGVGEWRPEKSGMNGTYQVDNSVELVEVGADV